MVPAKNVGAPEEPLDNRAEPQGTKKADGIVRPATQSATDGGKRSKFKEVLNDKLDEKKEAVEFVATDDDGEETVISPFALAAEKPVKKEAVSVAPTIADELPVTDDTETKGQGVGAEVVITKTKVDGEPVRVEVSVKTPTDEMHTVATPVGTTRDLKTEKSDTTVEPVGSPTNKPAVDTDEHIDKKPKDDTVVINLAAQSQIGLAEVPIATALNKVPDEAVKAREVLIKLANEMISRIDEIKMPDRTDTTIRLQYPPLFNGAELVITQYKSAQKEFNVTFSGLSPDARMLIEVQQNQEGLRTALLEKGYTLQMLTIEQRIPGLESTKTATGSLDLRQKEAEAREDETTDLT